jgi:hypothetical protein
MDNRRRKGLERNGGCKVNQAIEIVTHLNLLSSFGGSAFTLALRG